MHVILEMIYTSFALDLLNTRMPHFQNYLIKEWKVSQLNEHTAQSPPVDGRSLWLLQPAED